MTCNSAIKKQSITYRSDFHILFHLGSWDERLTHNNINIKRKALVNAINYIADIDECTAQDDICTSNAECINTAGSYECGCKEGYTGNQYHCEGNLNLSNNLSMLQTIVLIFAVVFPDKLCEISIIKTGEVILNRKAKMAQIS